MITISVVTITYNAAEVLQSTLDSVMMQDFPHVEHLIVDGASKDSTVKIAQTYKIASDEAENGHKIRISSEPDGGLYDAMNKGLQRATGDYIVFLNAVTVSPLPIRWSWWHWLLRLATARNAQRCSMATLISSMRMVISSFIAIFSLQRTSHGNRSRTVCLCAIKLFMHV